MKCDTKGCRRIAIFNFKDHTNGILCDDHKKDGMINLTESYCEYQDCDQIANYNIIRKFIISHVYCII